MTTDILKSRRLLLAYFLTNYINKTLLGLAPVAPRKSWDRSTVYRVADILPHMKLVSRACRPGLTVGFLRILCNVLCTAQRFHTEEHYHTCRVGGPIEPDSLSHYNECPRLYGIFTSFLGQAAALPRRNHLLHDLITQVFLRSLQYGIVVMGFIDALV